MSVSAVFEHPNYRLVNGDKVERKPNAPPLAEDNKGQEDQSVLEAVATYIQDRFRREWNFQEVWIPSDDTDPRCSILVSPEWQHAPKLLLVLQNAVGSQLGIWSRTLCLDSGLNRGSMLPQIQKALREHYGVMILRPNYNSVAVEVGGGKIRKIVIEGSSSPEEHVLFVWDNIVSSESEANHICLLAYGNGAYLAKEILQRQIVRSRNLERNKISAIATIEASTIVEGDDAEDVKQFLLHRAVDWESCSAAAMYRLKDRQTRLGCYTLSLGDLGAGVSNVAWSVLSATDSAFRFLSMATSGEHADVHDIALTFCQQEARSANLDPNTAETNSSPPSALADPPEPISSPSSSSGAQAKPPSFFNKIFGRSKTGSSSSSSTMSSSPSSGVSSSPSSTNPNQSASTTGSSSRPHGDLDDPINFGDQGRRMTVDDFDLLKVVGKGAFGKVMLVRKKTPPGEGSVYAMKVLKKSVIVAKGQVEHTKSERSILMEIRHPFVVRLRFAFQSEDKLYIVTDYYNGGSLFYHLRKSRSFSEERGKFYGAELLTALDHLHQQNIIYRDLKLENVLMDCHGHIALTDFGLSKQNIDMSGGATTFCGTAEYIAPELLKGQKYGIGVDWWSFGILLFEMMAGRTPFYDKNRKLMFYKIINTAPQYPPNFSEEACAVIQLLLRSNPSERLGCGDAAANDIMVHPFFRTIDFDALLRMELPPPFQPEVKDELDTTYVPKAYLQTEAKDSIDEGKMAPGGGGGVGQAAASSSTTTGGNQGPQFAQFTYAGESSLMNDEN